MARVDIAHRQRQQDLAESRSENLVLKEAPKPAGSQTFRTSKMEITIPSNAPLGRKENFLRDNPDAMIVGEWISDGKGGSKYKRYKTPRRAIRLTEDRPPDNA